MEGGRGQKSWEFADVLNGWSPTSKLSCMLQRILRGPLMIHTGPTVLQFSKAGGQKYFRKVCELWFSSKLGYIAFFVLQNE